MAGFCKLTGVSTRWVIPHAQPFGRETAALLAVGPKAVLSHQSAAFVWGIVPAPPDDVPVDVLVPARHVRRRLGIVAHRTTRLDRSEARICQGLPVTSPARTLRDIAGTVTMRELERAVDEALVRRIVRLQQLRAAVARDKGRRGGPILAALLEHRGNTTITRSQAEERMLELVRAAGFPPPETQRPSQRLRGRLPVAPPAARRRDRRIHVSRDAARRSSATAPRTPPWPQPATWSSGSPGCRWSTSPTSSSSTSPRRWPAGSMKGSVRPDRKTPRDVRAPTRCSSHARARLGPSPTAGTPQSRGDRRDRRRGRPCQRRRRVLDLHPERAPGERLVSHAQGRRDRQRRHRRGCGRCR